MLKILLLKILVLKNLVLKNINVKNFSVENISLRNAVTFQGFAGFKQKWGIILTLIYLTINFFQTDFQTKILENMTFLDFSCEQKISVCFKKTSYFGKLKI